jgi:hypothetical protein
MSVETVGRIIEVVLAPVVLVTACAILGSGFLAHYAEVNVRLRILSAERLTLICQRPSTPADARFKAERLLEIDQQLPELLSRHTLVRNALSSLYLAILLFVADMIMLSIAAVSEARVPAIASLALFVGGTGVLLCAILLVVVELRRSHRAVQSEVRRVAGLDGQGSGETLIP